MNTTDTKAVEVIVRAPVDRVKLPYSYYVSYSWSSRGESGYGSVTMDVENKMDTQEGITAVRKWIESSESTRGTCVVILFFTQLRVD